MVELRCITLRGIVMHDPRSACYQVPRSAQALELGQAAQDRELQPSVRRRSVSPGITQGLEACPSLADCRKSVE